MTGVPHRPSSSDGHPSVSLLISFAIALVLRRSTLSGLRRRMSIWPEHSEPTEKRNAEDEERQPLSSRVASDLPETGLLAPFALSCVQIATTEQSVLPHRSRQRQRLRSWNNETSFEMPCMANAERIYLCLHIVPEGVDVHWSPVRGSVPRVYVLYSTRILWVKVFVSVLPCTRRFRGQIFQRIAQWRPHDRSSRC